MPPVREGGDTLFYAEAAGPERGLSVDLELDRETWAGIRDGDTVTFDVRPGLLGAAWYEGYAIGRP